MQTRMEKRKGKKQEAIRKQEGKEGAVMTLRDMSISPCLKIGPKALEILILESCHATELIMLFLDKITKSSMFSFNIG